MSTKEALQHLAEHLADKDFDKADVLREFLIKDLGYPANSIQEYDDYLLVKHDGDPRFAVTYLSSIEQIGGRPAKRSALGQIHGHLNENPLLFVIATDGRTLAVLMTDDKEIGFFNRERGFPIDPFGASDEDLAAIKSFAHRTYDRSVILHYLRKQSLEIMSAYIKNVLAGDNDALKHLVTHIPGVTLKARYDIAHHRAEARKVIEETMAELAPAAAPIADQDAFNGAVISEVKRIFQIALQIATVQKLVMTEEPAPETAPAPEDLPEEPSAEPEVVAEEVLESQADIVEDPEPEVTQDVIGDSAEEEESPTEEVAVLPETVPEEASAEDQNVLAVEINPEWL